MALTSQMQSIDIFVSNLKELLRARPLQLEELCLMYSLKYGAAVNNVLSDLGLPADLISFIQVRADLMFENNAVYAVDNSDALADVPIFCPATEIQNIIREEMIDNNAFVVDIKLICTKFLAKFNVSLSSVVGMRPIEFLEEHPNKFSIMNRSTVCIAAPGLTPPSPTLQSIMASTAIAEVEKPKATFAPTQGNWRKRSSLNVDTDLSSALSKADRFAAAFGTSHRASPTSLRWSPQSSNKNSSGYMSSSTRSQGSVDDSSSSETEQAPDQIYYDLHTKISSRSFNSRVAQTTIQVMEAVQNACFLDIESVAKCGAAGMGTVIDTCCDAKLVFYINNLPQENQAHWMPALLRGLKAVLVTQLPNQLLVNGEAKVTDDQTAVRFATRDGITIDIQLAPVFESHADALVALGNHSPSARQWFQPVFAKELTHFVGKQPGSVKVTMRLLKWWREEQEWSTELCRPSDDIIHLIAIYSAMQTKPHDQKVAIANCMSLFAHFDELRVFWSNYYKRSDIWSPLLLQRPLLMDPVNPFVNVADPLVFDPRELIQKAATTRFFW